MRVFAIPIVFGGVVAQQTDVKKIGCARLKFERRQISLVQGGSIGPNPTDPIFLEELNELRPMPSGMTKLNGEPEVTRKLGNK